MMTTIKVRHSSATGDHFLTMLVDVEDSIINNIRREDGEAEDAQEALDAAIERALDAYLTAIGRAKRLCRVIEEQTDGERVYWCRRHVEFPD